MHRRHDALCDARADCLKKRETRTRRRVVPSAARGSWHAHGAAPIVGLRELWRFRCTGDSSNAPSALRWVPHGSARAARQMAGAICDRRREPAARAASDRVAGRQDRPPRAAPVLPSCPMPARAPRIVLLVWMIRVARAQFASNSPAIPIARRLATATPSAGPTKRASS